MTFLLAIEGADGVGKQTAANNVRDQLQQLGLKATVISFPRYRDTVGGAALGEFLAGRMPVAVTPQAAAVLYALDRAESIEFVQHAMSTSDVVILDRYIASNMVYQASKVASVDADKFMQWIWDLETRTFGVVPPTLTVYLDTPLAQAQELMLLKGRRTYTDRQLDEHEADLALQKKVREHYAELSAGSAYGRWRRVEAFRDGHLRAPKEISREIVSVAQEEGLIAAQDSTLRRTA